MLWSEKWPCFGQKVGLKTSWCTTWGYNRAPILRLCTTELIKYLVDPYQSEKCAEILNEASYSALKSRYCCVWHFSFVFFSGWYTRFCQAISRNLCFLGYCLSLRFNLPHSSLLLGSYKSQLSRAQFCIEKLLDYSRCSSINSGYYILDTFKTFPVRIPFCSK